MSELTSIGNARSIIREVSKVIVGKDESLIKILLAIIAGGHILMEDIPGVGKTTMLLQRILEKYPHPDDTFYMSLDHFWFQTHTLQDLVTGEKWKTANLG